MLKKTGLEREKDLAYFLIWDYIKDIESLEGVKFYGMEKVFSINSKIASQKYEKYNIIFNFIDKIYSSVIFLGCNRFKNKKKKILFITCNNYSSIILTAKRKYNVETIVEGKRDRLFAIKHFIKYYSYSNLSQLVYDYFIKKDESYLCEFAKKIKKIIKKANPDYIVMSNDCLPKERAVILAAKEMNIPTLEIQHGVYDSFMNNPLIGGGDVDYLLVWGKYFKDLYLEQKIRKQEDVYILGYPYSIIRKRIARKKDNHYLVYYLGQNFEVIDKELLNVKIKTVKELNKICNKLGMRFIYRPHPGDDRLLLKEKLPEICFSFPKEKLEDSIGKGDIFISFNSTSLVEASLRQKICMQLMNYPMKVDNFEQLGACLKSFYTIEKLEKYLAEIVNTIDLNKFKLQFNNNYIETRYNPNERFLKIIKEIKKNYGRLS